MQMRRDLPESFADEDFAGSRLELLWEKPEGVTCHEEVPGNLAQGTVSVGELVHSDVALAYVSVPDNAQDNPCWGSLLTSHGTIMYDVVSLPRASAAVGCGVNWRTPAFARAGRHTCNTSRRCCP